MVSVLRTAAVVGLWMTSAAVWATVELDITPTPVIMGESFQIEFRVTSQTRGEPDLSPLEKAFEILRRNRQSSLKWNNGRREEFTSWIFDAMPRYSGQVEIPPISFGSDHSQARVIEVVAASDARRDAGARVILQVEATPRTPYVQQQVIYTVRLLHRVELGSPRISSLTTSSDAIIKQLGKTRKYVDRVEGLSYDVREMRYAIYPQTSGPLTVYPIVLTTQMAIGKRTIFDPYIRNVTTKRIESETVELEIKPIPAAFPKDAAWLPAQRLRLYEDWEPDIDAADVGAPLNRTIFLWADGLISGQLPDVRIEAPPGIKLYPVQPETTDKVTAGGFTSELRKKFAFIANRAGIVRFAAVEVPWWNTDLDQLEHTRLGARSLTFAGTTSAEPPSTDKGVPTSFDRRAVSLFTELHLPAAMYWSPVAMSLAFVWLSTLGFWWLGARRTLADGENGRAPPRPSRARRDLKSACRTHSPVRARRALMDWSAAMAALSGHAELRTLGALAAHMDGELAREIKALERHIYGKSAAAWQGAALWDAFRSYRRVTGTTAAPVDDPLPPIFKLSGEL